MTFLAPAWLWLLLLVPLPLVWPRRLAPRALWRAAVLLLIVLGLAQPARLGTTDAPAYVLLVDTSPSSAIDPAQLTERTHALAQALGEQGSVQVRRFEHSLIGAELEAAQALLPAGQAAAVVLVSDGQSRDATWPAAAQALRARGAELVQIELPTRNVPRVTHLGVGPAFDPLTEARVGAPLTLFAQVHNPGPARDVVLTYARDLDAAPLELARVALPAETSAAVRFDLEPGSDMLGAGQLEVALAGAETASLRTDVYVAPAKRVLYLSSRGGAAREQLQGLVGAGLELVTPGDLGLDVTAFTRADLATFDLIVLDDQPAAELGDGFLAGLSDAVRLDGVGLFATGGERAFGPGGWHNTSIETLLPIELIQKEEKRDPSTTLVVIIDTSGSMGGQRVQLAKEVSRLAIQRLLPHDKVGIVEFYGAKHWAAPIQPASNAIELERALNRLSASGGTVILPAIEEAYYGLKNVRTRYKHVLILTDGGVETGAFEPLLRSMAEEGINVSTVLIGGNAHSEFLVTLSNWGKGRFYSVPNRFNLPEIILKQPTTAKLPALRPGPHVLRPRGGAYWWGTALAPESEPLVVDAYVETRLRPGASALLESQAERHPVLATWALGQGRVTAMMTELTGPSSDAWRDAAFLGPLLGRVLEQTRRAEEPAELAAAGRGAALRAELNLSTTARDPNAPRTASQALVRVPSERATWITAESLAGGASLGAFAPAAWTGEFNVPAERAFTLASDRVLPYADWTADWRPTPGPGQPVARLLPFGPWLLILALLTYLAEVLWRRSSYNTRT